MKKILLFCLSLLVLFSIFASEQGTGFVFEGIADSGFKPALSEIDDTLDYFLYENPSEFSKERFKISVPSFYVTANHVAAILTNYSDVLVNFKNMSYQELANKGLELLRKFPGSFSDVATLDFSTGAQIKNYGFGLNFQLGMKSFADNYYAQVTNIGLYPFMDGAVSLGYGNTYENDILIVNGGASVHFAVKAVTEEIEASNLADIASGEVTLGNVMDKVKVDAGFALTSNLGVSIRMKTKHDFGVDLIAQNIPGFYWMERFDSISDLTSLKDNGESYRLTTPSNLGIFLYMNLFPSDWKYISGYEKIGANCYKKADGNITSALYSKLNICFFNFFECSYIYNGGNNSFSVASSFHGNKLEISYGWHEETFGFNDTRIVDALTVGLNLGYEK